MEGKFKIYIKKWSLVFSLVLVLILIFLISLGVIFKANSRPNYGVSSQPLESINQDNFYLYFARVESLYLYLPVKIEQLRGVGFHEAEKTNAVTLEPLGECLENDNPYETRINYTNTDFFIFNRFPQYWIMLSRGRPTNATTACDIAISKGAKVKSVIDGYVYDIKPYLLYGYIPDYELWLRPANRYDYLVVILHLDELKVKIGERVLQGQTILGYPIDLSSDLNPDINKYLDENKSPHIHVEVKTSR